MRRMGSRLLTAAEETRVAAGGALAVDRDAFSAAVTRMVEQCENITVHREQVETIDESAPILVATGPLTDGALADEIGRLTGDERLHFYDAVAPIVTAESLDYGKVFAASRYDRGEADYLNCPFNKAEYEAFHAALAGAERAPLHDFDTGAEQSAKPDPDAHGKKADTVTVYEGCMPIEIMAARGADTMRFGPLRPVGLVDPNTGHRPWANVQLRAENKERTLYNIVGFQTNLKWGEQKRVFSMIPGLENAEFVRYGVMHRNTFLDAPRVLSTQLCLKKHPNVFFAGQITGFEGYMESAACGLLAARNLYARLKGRQLPPPGTSGCVTWHRLSALLPASSTGWRRTLCKANHLKGENRYEDHCGHDGRRQRPAGCSGRRCTGRQGVRRAADRCGQRGTGAQNCRRAQHSAGRH